MCLVPLYPYGEAAADIVMNYNTSNDFILNGTLISKPVYFSTSVPVGNKHLEKVAFVSYVIKHYTFFINLYKLLKQLTFVTYNDTF